MQNIVINLSDLHSPLAWYISKVASGIKVWKSTFSNWASSYRHGWGWELTVCSLKPSHILATSHHRIYMCSIPYNTNASSHYSLLILMLHHITLYNTNASSHYSFFLGIALLVKLYSREVWPILCFILGRLGVDLAMDQIFVSTLMHTCFVP